MNLFAKRVGSQIHLFERRGDHAILIGKLLRYDDRTALVSDDEELAYSVNGGIAGWMRLRGVLAVVRGRCMALNEQRRKEAEAERISEDGWLRAAEYAPDQLAEMEREDIYCV